MVFITGMTYVTFVLVVDVSYRVAVTAATII